jgi:AcrR family transcriptional regulator
VAQPRDVTSEAVGRGSPVIQTRERLIVAARDVICDVGLRQARMEDIAARAGVSRAALYYHFNTKADLVAAIVDDVCLRLTDIVRASLADGPLDAVIAATVRFFAGHVAVARLLITEMTLPADPLRLVTRHRDALLSILRRRVTADVAAGRIRPMDPDVAAQAIVGLIRVAPVEMICNESVDLDHLTAQLTDFLRHALAPSPLTAPQS